MKRQREGQIKKAILDYLKLKGWLCVPQRSVGIWKSKTGKYIPMRPSQKGVADILCIAPFRDFGLPVAIEIKTEEGRLTESQREFLREWQERGGIAKVARSLDDVIYLQDKLRLSSSSENWNKSLKIIRESLKIIREEEI